MCRSRQARNIRDVACAGARNRRTLDEFGARIGFATIAPRSQEALIEEFCRFDGSQGPRREERVWAWPLRERSSRGAARRTTGGEQGVPAGIRSVRRAECIQDARSTGEGVLPLRNTSSLRRDSHATPNALQGGSAALHPPAEPGLDRRFCRDSQASARKGSDERTLTREPSKPMHNQTPRRRYCNWRSLVW
jgi:hypothetical protein